jgi:hypothetical protein
VAFLIVGGSARGVGKTTVVCELIRAFQELAPIALKVTSHPHTPEDTWRVEEEISVVGDKDTARYLKAGAKRALLICVPDSCPDGFARIEQMFGGESLVILESTRAAGRVKACFSLYVTAPGVQEKKSNAFGVTTLFDAVLSNNRVQAPMVEQPNLYASCPNGELPVEILRKIHQKLTDNSSQKNEMR